jgi:hypothetical protein
MREDKKHHYNMSTNNALKFTYKVFLRGVLVLVNFITDSCRKTAKMGVCSQPFPEHVS